MIWNKKWFPWLIGLVIGLALGAVLTTLLFTDKTISIKINLSEGSIEISGGPVQIPNGIIKLGSDGRTYITTDHGDILLRQYFEEQGYQVSWDAKREEIVIRK